MQEQTYRIIRHSAINANSKFGGTKNKKIRFKSQVRTKINGIKKELKTYIEGVKSSASKSKYLGGFINGKNSPAYNHDYYIHNKEKWKVGASFRKLGIPDEVLEESKNHKYLYRITMPDGSYRYFYSEAEYSRYLSRVGQINGEHSIEEDAKNTNPHYKEGIEYQMNCGFCGVAYDMRRRGYDVQAKPDSNGLGLYDISTLYKTKYGTSPTPMGIPIEMNPDETTVDEYRQKLSDSFFNELNKFDDGARGYVYLDWEFGPAHIVNFEKVGNEVYIVDSQTNKIYTQSEFNSEVLPKIALDWNDVFFSELSDKYRSDAIGYLRVDDCEFTNNISDFKYHWRRRTMKDFKATVSGEPFVANSNREPSSAEKDGIFYTEELVKR